MTNSYYALIHFGVCITQLNSNVTLKLVKELNRVYTRDGLDEGRLTVGDVANGSCGKTKGRKSRGSTVKPETQGYDGAVPMLMVAWREMTSGERGVNFEMSKFSRSFEMRVANGDGFMWVGISSM